MRKLFAFLFFALFLAPAPLGARPFSRGRIVVHPGGRYLQYADGRPFFYLGDTAWELFHRTTREEARLYLEDRARKGFTVIQAVCLAERDGLRVPNAYGDLPFADAGFTRPNERYFAYVDEVVAMAACCPHGATSSASNGAPGPRSSRRRGVPRLSGAIWGSVTASGGISSGYWAATVLPKGVNPYCGPSPAALPAVSPAARIIRPA